MPRPKSLHPTYCLHKQSGRAYCTIDGKQRLLPGKYDSAESRAAFDALHAQWLSNGRQLPTEPVAGVTVALAFWKHPQTFYRHADGTPTGEAANYHQRCGRCVAYTARPPLLASALRTAMLLPRDENDPKTGKTTRHTGWSRTYANRQVERSKAVFRWAASEELISASVPAGLATLSAIRTGRDGARETEPVAPVADERVDVTLPFLPPPVAALVKLQRLTGARGGELFKLRSADLDMSGPVWKYRPARHKTAHKGHRRVIRFGPQAQQILEPEWPPDYIGSRTNVGRIPEAWTRPIVQTPQSIRHTSCRA